MTHNPRPNSFRADVLSIGQRPSPLVSEKTPKVDPRAAGLDAVGLPRSETRRGNHRDEDRHRLSGHTAQLRYRGKKHVVELINVSGGGAMIRADFTPRLWDLVELHLGEGAAIECAVRWLREDRVGLEFAHETRIECDPEQRDALLLEIIRRSFPDLAEPAAKAEAPAPAAAQSGGAEHRDAIRHPLIWRGVIHSAHDSQPVRLRNISSGGALVHVVSPCEPGAEVVLDLAGAGRQAASVTWVQGDQVGLRFDQPFDLESLVETRPEIMAQEWVRPSYLDPSSESDSAWDPQWSRQSLGEISSMLEGFIKH